MTGIYSQIILLYFPNVRMAMINGAKGKERIKEGTWNSERPFNRVNMVQESNVLLNDWCVVNWEYSLIGKNRSRNRLLKEYLVDNAA